MCVLEVIVIGGAVYYYKKHHKVNKARKAAFAAGQPFHEQDGSVTFPPLYPGLPPLPDNAVITRQPEQIPREYYTDAPAVTPNKKTGSMVETREITVADGKV